MVFNEAKSPVIFFAAVCGAISVALFILSAVHFLLFHIFVEFFTIFTVCSIFVISYNTRHYFRNDFLVLLGYFCLALGYFAVLHVITYQGMLILPQFTVNVSVQLWIVIRYLHGIGFLLGIYCIKRTINNGFVAASLFVVSALLTFIIFNKLGFPDCFFPETGLTLFKVVSEYLVIGMHSVAFILLYRMKTEFESRIFMSLGISLVCAIMSGIFFTLYRSAFGVTNILGHYSMFVSFCFLYMAIVKKCLADPVSLLFGDLRKQKDAVQRLNKTLESEIASKTQSLLDAREKLVKSERLSVIGQMGGVIAHEFRNQLAVIKNVWWSLRMEMHDISPQTQRKFELLDDQLRKAEHVIQNILEYARTQALVSQRLDFVAWVRELLADMSEHDPFGKGIQIEKSICDGSIDVMLDCIKFERVIENLISNAAAAMGNSGIVSISVSADCDYAYFSVSDLGPGVPFENREKIFEPLFTTKASGTGFGLAMVKRIVEQHGGTIGVDNNGDGGAVFMISLPRLP